MRKVSKRRFRWRSFGPTPAPTPGVHGARAGASPAQPQSLIP
jgi:hypothetical protein